jgi:hypothetical protein
MKEITIPFSIFDFFAVLLPGGIGLLGLYMFVNPTLALDVHQSIFSGSILFEIKGDFAIITILVIASYLMGHVLNALSDILIDTSMNKIFGAHIRKDIENPIVNKAISQEFGKNILKQNYRRIFVAVEAIVSKNVPDAVITARRYIALAVMFESLTLSVIIILAALLKGFILNKFCFSLPIFLFPIVLIALTFVFIWSYRKYKGMWSRVFTMSFSACVKSRNACDVKDGN